MPSPIESGAIGCYNQAMSKRFARTVLPALLVLATLGTPVSIPGPDRGRVAFGQLTSPEAPPVRRMQPAPLAELNGDALDLLGPSALLARGASLPVPGLPAGSVGRLRDFDPGSRNRARGPSLPRAPPLLL